MELKQYQKQAMTTCMESSNNVAYMLYNLISEVGELTSNVIWLSLSPGDKYGPLLQSFTLLSQIFGEYSKEIRKNPDNEDVKTSVKCYGKDAILKHANKADLERFQKEAGDILWQLSGLCSVMGWDMDDIAQQNLDKLASRQKRGVIDGSGDNR